MKTKQADIIDYMEEDEDGAWIYLKNGYHLDNVHSIHEDTMKQAKKRLSGVEPCTCKDCKSYVPKIEKSTWGIAMKQAAAMTPTPPIQHTPGPWSINGGRIEPQNPDLQGHICVVGEINNQTLRDTGNARLIAAAPELLEALKELREHVGDNVSKASLKADKAIHRATGRGE